MIPTPDFSHLRPEDYEHVYEPAEDTFILLDALEQDADQIVGMKPLIALEIGSGSGGVSSFLGGIAGPSAVLYLCTDINQHACRASVSTGRQNKVSLEVINTSFANSLLSRLHKSVDLVLFNPPYVPTINDEASGAQDSKGIAGSWAGGQDGMQITERFLPQIDNLLSACGRFYLVAVAQNNIPGIRRRMRDEYALESEIVLQRRAGREHLSVLRFAREPQTK
ncbi:S-adenosyl-L-methionine-dependent methyltransferase [Mycena sp. CBHHK59/15]|nr:S-adenosyl-L-methionine-dependent methyltransferase [Mycena sp. CBHHK59/15]